jgi:stearoyl-CoA desaturase (delta-9 desaturase)
VSEAATGSTIWRTSRGERWKGALPFVTIHLLSLLSLVTGVRPVDVAVCLTLYFVRMFAVTGAYHRYFSHRSYKTSRAFQWVLAFLAQTSAQKGALWWAAHHRVHHKYSDEPQDVHSPRQKGILYAHLGWLFDGTADTDYERVKDLTKYRELVWLNEHPLLPAIALGVAVWWFFGWSGLWFGFMFSTVLLWHGTFTINSLSHVIGSQRYDTGDDSRNHGLLALITLGEGWHNNHHYYQASTRQGFRWWEIDITYAILRVLSVIGLVWDLREPPPAVLDGTWRPRKRADDGARMSRAA